MKTYAKVGSNILNAFAFANVGNMNEFRQLLAQSTVIPATGVKQPSQLRSGSTPEQPRVELADSTDTATTTFCVTHD